MDVVIVVDVIVVVVVVGRIWRCRRRLVLVENVIIVDIDLVNADVALDVVSVDVDDVDLVVADVVHVGDDVVVVREVVEVRQLEQLKLKLMIFFVIYTLRPARAGWGGRCSILGVLQPIRLQNSLRHTLFTILSMVT